jgi:hypothetical protein
MLAFHLSRHARQLRAAAAGVVVASLILGGPAASAEAAGGVSVTVRCDSNPEKVTIRNNKGTSVRIVSVGSTYHPYSDEPFVVNKTLGAGKGITYSFGTASGPHKLTGRFIFDNEAPTESARVKLGFGKIRRYC